MPELDPFNNCHCTDDIADLTPNSYLRIVRPHYHSNGFTFGEVEIIEGNIQEAIDNKVENIFITERAANIKTHIIRNLARTFEDDVYRLLDAGYVRRLVIRGHLKSNGKLYQVDFLSSDATFVNIGSHYRQEDGRTVVMENNKLISKEKRFLIPPIDTISEFTY